MRKIKFYVSNESKKTSPAKGVMASACCTSTTIGDREKLKGKLVIEAESKA